MPSDTAANSSPKPKTMVTVYFETKGYAEQVATFEREETYMLCLPELEKLCKEQGFEFVTETITE